VTEFFAQNPLYIVLAIVLVIWFAIYGYLFRLERRIHDLEQSANR
jgi:CcmD family protein